MSTYRSPKKPSRRPLSIYNISFSHPPIWWHHVILETLQSIPCINFTANELASGGELKSQDFFIEVVVNNAVASLEQTQDDKYVFSGQTFASFDDRMTSGGTRQRPGHDNRSSSRGSFFTIHNKIIKQRCAGDAEDWSLITKWR